MEKSLVSKFVRNSTVVEKTKEKEVVGVEQEYGGGSYLLCSAVEERKNSETDFSPLDVLVSNYKQVSPLVTIPELWCPEPPTPPRHSTVSNGALFARNNCSRAR